MEVFGANPTIIDKITVNQNCFLCLYLEHPETSINKDNCEIFLFLVKSFILITYTVFRKLDECAAFASIP